jgi:hypothetical protein
MSTRRVIESEKKYITEDAELSVVDLVRASVRDAAFLCWRNIVLRIRPLSQRWLSGLLRKTIFLQHSTQTASFFLLRPVVGPVLWRVSTTNHNFGQIVDGDLIIQSHHLTVVMAELCISLPSTATCQSARVRDSSCAPGWKRIDDPDHNHLLHTDHSK